MTPLESIRVERTRIVSPVGFLLRDAFNAQAPTARVSAFLEIFKGTEWRLTDVEPVETTGGILIYPRLGRQNRPTESAPRSYRVKFDSEAFRVVYPPDKDSFEFTVKPYNDVEPPVLTNPQLFLVHLIPTSVYPFPAQVPVARGRVVGADGLPVVGVEVFDGTTESAFTDARGVFALPLRNAAPGPLPIFAGGTVLVPLGEITIDFPKDLKRSLLITLP